MIELRTPRQIDQMRPAGRFVAEVLTALTAAADVGVNLLELDALAHRMITERGATSCYVDYHPSFGASPFGKVLCTSVNDAVLHGLPRDYRLADGDLLSLDFAASVDGWVADSAVSLVVGRAREADLALIGATERALAAAIEQAVVGNRMGDISHAIGATARDAGLSVNLEFGGHGVGRTMHGDPHVSNDGRPGRGLVLKPAARALSPMAWLMSPIRLPATDCSMAAARARSVAAISARSASRARPTIRLTAESATQPSTEAAKSRLSRSPSASR
jgi:methionyl aminopeptidase